MLFETLYTPVASSAKKRILCLFAFCISTLLCNAQPDFIRTSPHSLNACSGHSLAISDTLSVSDTAGVLLTWSVVSAPGHGELTGFSTSATSLAGTTAPSGLFYLPTAGYTGPDVFTIRVSDGVTTDLLQLNVTVHALPAVSFTASPSGTICANTDVTYTTQAGFSNYSWSLPGSAGTDYIITGGSTSPSSSTVTLKWLSTGSKSVTVNYGNGNNCFALAPAVTSASVTAPVITFASAAPAASCVNTNYTYTTQAGQSNYIWSMPGSSFGSDYSIVSGGTSASNSVTLRWLTPGNRKVAVNYTNASGCSATSPVDTTAIVSNVLPIVSFDVAPGPQACASQDVTYTTQGGQTAYSWATPGSTTADYTITAGSMTSNSVTLKWTTPGSRTVAVNYTSNTGCAALLPASALTNVNTLPVVTFVTFAPADVCEQTPIVYSTQTGQSNYAWSTSGSLGINYTVISGGTSGSSSYILKWLTAGTQTVTVNYDNSSGCHALTPTANSTTVHLLPVPTFTVAPGANICANSDVVYSTQPSQFNYLWTVSGTNGVDYTIIAGGTGTTDNTVTIRWLTAGPRTVTVNYNNSAGCTGATAASVTSAVNAQPVVTFTTQPGADVCANNAITYTTQSGQSLYAWTVPGTPGIDYTITGGGAGPTSSSVTLKWLNEATRTVSVNYNNAAGCTATTATANTTTVHALPVVSYTTMPGTNTCLNEVVTYTTQAGQSSYTWNVPGVAGTDYDITSGGIGALSNSVSLRWRTATAKVVTINYANINGCSALTAISNTTTVRTLPDVSFIATPSASLCVNVNATYTTQSSGFNYTWTTTGTPGVDYTIVSGGTTTSSTYTLKWLTPGAKTVSVNYENGFGCIDTVVQHNMNANAPNVTFTSSPAATHMCITNNVTYTTQSGQSNYSWSLPGTLGVNFNIVGGSTATSSNTVSVHWLTSGIKVVSVNYASGGCTPVAPRRDTVIVDTIPTVTFTAAPLANSCTSLNVLYATQPNQANYAWDFPSASEYTIVSGGIGTSDDSVTIQWLTPGIKVVSVNYNTPGICLSTGQAQHTATVHTSPVASLSASPSGTVCANVPVIYSTQSSHGGYGWSLTGFPGSDYDVTSGSLFSDQVGITWRTGGPKQLFVNYSDVNGCHSPDSASHSTTVLPPPTVTCSAIPSASICRNETVTYTTQPGQANYVWTVSGPAANYEIIAGSLSPTSNSVTLRWLVAGNSNVSVNYSNSNGCTAASPAIVVTTVNELPVVSFSAAPASICAHALATYITQSGQGNYVWSIQGTAGTHYQLVSGGTSTSNTVTLRWLVAGTQTVAVNYTNAAGCTATVPAVATTIVNPLPVVTFTESPLATSCSGFELTYKTQPGQSNYTWSIPGTSGINYSLVSGGALSDNVLTIKWLTPGNQSISVNYADGNTCSATVSTVHTTNVTLSPSVSFTSSASASTCAEQTVIYSTQTGMSNYVWSVPGTPDVDYSIITGSTGSASSSVSLKWHSGPSRSVSVNYLSNGCVSPTPPINTTTVNPLPNVVFSSAPGATTCAEVSVTYTTQGGNSNYVWSTPGSTAADYTIETGSMGTSSSSVTLKWHTSGPRTVSVNYSALGCAALSPTSSSTSINGLPNVTFDATPDSICRDGLVTYTTQAGKLNYAWSLPSSGYSIVAGSILNTSNTVTIKWTTTGSKRVQVNYSELTGCSALLSVSDSVVVNPLPTPSITPSKTTVCIDDTVTYITQPGYYNYTWTYHTSLLPTTDYVVDGGGDGSNMLRLKWKSHAALFNPVTIYVDYQNVHGCRASVPVPVAVTVNTAIPTATFTGVISDSACEKKNTIIYTTQSDQARYKWEIPGADGTDYNVLGGAGSETSNTVTIKWITRGSKTVKVSYTSLGGCASSTVTATTTVNPLPVVTLTSQPGASVCARQVVTYATQKSQNTYIWGNFGAAGGYELLTPISTDSSHVTLKWNTTGDHSILVGYINQYGCYDSLISTTNVKALPAVSFSSIVPSSICRNGVVLYTTQENMSDYSWVVLPDSVGLHYSIVAGGAGALSNTVSIKWLKDGVKKVSVNYKNADGCAAETAFSANITVNGLPNVSFTQAPDSQICQNSVVTYATEPGQQNYIWRFPAGLSSSDTTVLDGGTSSNSHSVQLRWNGSASGAKKVSVIYTDPSTGCTAISPRDTTSIIYALPRLISPPYEKICSGFTFIDTLRADSLCTYSWSVSNRGPASVAVPPSASPGSTVINNFLFNSSPFVQDTLVYRIVPTASQGPQCQGLPDSFGVVVYPSPVDTTASSFAICSQFGPNIHLAPTVPSSYTWRASSISDIIVNDTSGTGSLIDGTLIDTLNYAAGTVVYVVTPTSVAPGFCLGSPHSITVVVNPKPVFTTKLTDSICSGEKLIVPLESTVSCKYGWTVSVNGLVTGASAGIDSFSIDTTLTNLSNSDKAIVSYTVIDTSLVGGCKGDPHRLDVTIFPRPVLDMKFTDSVCSSLPLSTVLVATTPSSFLWGASNNPAGILGTHANVSSLVINDTLVNLTNNAIGIVTYSVLPTSSDGLCAALAPQFIQVSVHPTPTLSVTSAVVCSDDHLDVPLSCSLNGSGGGCSYSNAIRPSFPNIRIVPMGDANHLQDTISSRYILTKDSVSYSISFQSQAGCKNTQPFKVVIEPTPIAPVINSFDSLLRGIVPCSGSAFVNFGALSPPQPTVQYTWSANVGDSILTAGNSQYCTISFNDTGLHHIELFANVTGFSCRSHATAIARRVDSSVSKEAPFVIYQNNSFMCLDNWVKVNCDTLYGSCWSYLWGWDTKDLVPQPQYKEINQIWYLGSTTIDPDKKYWVITIDSTTGCPQKSYYDPNKGPRSGAGGDMPISMNVYPNPASSSITIELQNVTSTAVSLTITDVMGRIVARENSVFSGTSIDIEALMPGAYIIRAQQEGSRAISKHFVKQ